MKTKTPKKTRESAIIEHDNPALLGATSVPFKSVEDITTEFLQKREKQAKKDGDNDYLREVALSLRMICANYRDRSWSANDILHLCSHMNLPAAAVLPIVFDWCAELKKYKRIKQVLGIYSFPTWTFV